MPGCEAPSVRYVLEFTPLAAKQFRRLTAAARRRLATPIDALASNPRPPNAKKLKGGRDAWRLRVGDYRIIYEIYDDRLLILVVRLGHRREVYRD